MNREQYLSLRKSLYLRREARHLWIQGLIDGSLCALIYLLQSTRWKWISIPLISILMFRQFSLMHDAVHGAVSQRRWFNDLVGSISGAISLLPYDLWRKIHLEHHLWSGNIEKDPAMALVKNFPLMSRKTQRSLNLIWRSWVPIMAFLQHVVFWSASFRQFFNAEKSLRACASLALPVLLWSVLLASTPSAFAIKILAPSILLYLVMVEVVNFPHHLELPHFQGDSKLPAWEQYQIARSCMYPIGLARFVTLNFNYHTEHHMFPDAPWYHLDTIHAAVKDAVGTGYNEDPQFAWILKNRSRTLNEVVKPTSQKNIEKKVA